MVNIAQSALKKSKVAFRTISEVSKELDVAQHVLRFWETKFPEIQPIKRGGGRRYYRPEDVELIKNIKTLLYKERYTIEGVQKLFKEKGVKNIFAEDNDESFFASEFLPPFAEQKQPIAKEEVLALINELKDIKSFIAQNI